MHRAAIEPSVYLKGGSLPDRVVEVRDLWRSYKRGSEIIHACAGIDFEVFSREIVSITGRSGSGKTTLLNLIGGLDTPTQGQVVINGVDIANLRERDLVSFRRGKIGFVFQMFYLIPTLTVRENVELPLIFSRNMSAQRVKIAMDRVGIREYQHMLPSQLDGGSMQKVAIARAIVNRPEILIADEPTGRLEAIARTNVLDIFRNLRAEGLSVIIATHDLALAQEADRQINLSDGKVVKNKEIS